MFLSLFCVSVSALEISDIPPEFQYTVDSRKNNSDGSYEISRYYFDKPLRLSIGSYTNNGNPISFPILSFSSQKAYRYVITYGKDGKVTKKVSYIPSWSGSVSMYEYMKGVNYFLSCNFKPINLDEYAEERPEFADILNKFFNLSINEIADECPLELVNFKVDIYPFGDGVPEMDPSNISKSLFSGNIKFTINNKSTKNVYFYLTVDNKSYFDTDVTLQSAEHQSHCKFNVKSKGDTGQSLVAKPGANEFFFRNCQWLPYLDLASFNFWLDRYTYLVPNAYGPQLMQISKYSYKCFSTQEYDFFSSGTRWSMTYQPDGNNFDDISVLPDSDFTGKVGGLDIDNITFKDSLSMFTSIFTNLQGILELYRSFFGILPEYFWVLMSMGLTIVIILRVLGR